MNANRANNALSLPRSMNSFVANTANTISNAASNLTNSFVNTGTNAMKNIASPISQSINAIPSSGPSMGLIIGMAVIIVLIAVVIMYSTPISEGLNNVWTRIRMFLGMTGTEVQQVATDAGQELQQAVTQVGEVVSPENTVNKFIPGKKQVFNISENKYTYNDAEPLCRAFGAELATYEQVKDAWKSGADWCNYGWVKGQAAVYPTQQDSWDKLQSGTDDERLQCGMPGVNGGFFQNPELRFGVNCYGDKPGETEHDRKNKLEGRDQPLTPEGTVQLKKQLKYKSQIGQIGVLPFNTGSWSG
jgi:Extracellular link domain